MRIIRKTPGITVALRRASEEDLLQMELKHPDDRLLPTLSAHEAWVMTVGSRNETVGFIEYFVNNEVLTITGHWVAPTHRGNGYGSIMLELVETAEKPMITRVLSIPSTEKFYRDRGFEPDRQLSVLSKTAA